MEWTSQEIRLLQDSIYKRYQEFRKENRTDPKNLSELWNKHILQIRITGIRTRAKKAMMVSDLVEVINFRNKDVSDALCVMNPDRPDQFLLVPRETAQTILVVGMP